jgi:hypothetical protein
MYRILIGVLLLGVSSLVVDGVMVTEPVTLLDVCATIICVGGCVIIGLGVE